MTDLLPYQLLPTAWLVGWTLIHFIWQAALVAALASFALACVDRRSAEVRYLVCAVSLACMAAAPVITLYVLATAQLVGVPSLALTALVIAPDLRQRIALLVPGFTLVWVLGVWVMQVRIAAQLLGARGLAHKDVSPLGEPLRGTVRSLCSQLGMRRVVQAYQSTRAAVPMVVGWLRPVVLVPSAALTGLSTAQLRAVLAHELAHIKRHDALVNLLQSVFESLFFFHPAVWWLSNRLRVEREFCCDDIAVATCGDPLTYAKALAALDDARSAWPAAVLAANGGSLMQRITRLLDTGRTTRRARGWIAPMIMTLSLTAVVSAMSLTVDEEPDATSTLKGVDLVKVVAPVDGELGEILGILRAGGMDDAMLLDFVTRLGTSPQVLDAIQGATEHAAMYAKHRAIEAELSEGHGQIKADVADGLITKQEAKLRIEALHRRMKEMSVELGLPSGNEPHGVSLHKAHLVEILKGRVSRVHEVEKIAHLKHKLQFLHEELAAGVKTADEVEPAIDKIQKHIEELMQRGELHPDHDVHFGPLEVGQTKHESGTISLHLRELDESPGAWTTEPRIHLAPETEVVGGAWVTGSVVELSPIEHGVFELGEPLEPSEGEWQVLPLKAQVRLLPQLPEAAIHDLHDHLRSASGEIETVRERLVEVFTVLSTMRAVPERFTELHVEPYARAVLIEEPIELIEEVEPIEEIEEVVLEEIEEIEADDT